MAETTTASATPATGSVPGTAGTSAPASDAPAPATPASQPTDTKAAAPEAPRPGSRAWDEAAVERIRAAAERKAAEKLAAEKPPGPAAEKPAEQEKPKVEEPPRPDTKELLARVRAEREKHAAAARARDLEERVRALEPASAKLQQFSEAIEKGDIRAALTALGIPKERWFTGDRSLYWQLAQMASAADQGDVADDDKPLTRKEWERLENERRQREQQEREERARQQAEAKRRREDAAGRAYVEEINVLWDPDKYPTVVKRFDDGLSYADMIKFFNAERARTGKTLEPEDFWPALEKHWKARLGIEEPKAAPAAPAAATPSPGSLKSTPGGVPDIKTMTVEQFDEMAREKLEKLGAAR